MLWAIDIEKGNKLNIFDTTVIIMPGFKLLNNNTLQDENGVGNQKKKIYIIIII